MPETNHQQESQSTGSTCTGCIPGSRPGTSFATVAGTRWSRRTAAPTRWSSSTQMLRSLRRSPCQALYTEQLVKNQKGSVQRQTNHCDIAGGLLDMLVILGPTPEDVAKQASAALGRCQALEGREWIFFLGFTSHHIGPLVTTCAVGATTLWRTCRQRSKGPLIWEFPWMHSGEI